MNRRWSAPERIARRAHAWYEANAYNPWLEAALLALSIPLTYIMVVIVLAL